MLHVGYVQGYSEDVTTIDS